MITKNQKKEIVSQLNEILDSAKSVVFTNFEKVSVEDQQALRGKLRENDCNYKVIKKTLIALVLKEKGFEISLDDIQGSVGLAYSDKDEVAPVKQSVDFGKDNETFKTFSCIVDGDVVEGSKLKQLAELPSKDVMRGQVVGTIAAPLSGFVNVLSGNLRGLVNVLKAKAEKGE